MDIFSNININQNEIFNPKIHNSQAPPSNPVNGQIFYSTQDGSLMCYGKGKWSTATIAAMTNIEIEEIIKN
ncbi:MAG: hypothetical protein Q4B14_03180 [Clostridia bacterium]|nr:hypothetical protein [Clostridia bacterium]